MAPTGEQTSAVDSLRVAVVGGSLGGLCAGVALHRVGADVTIYEKSEVMASRGAGIVVQPDLLRPLAVGGAPLATTTCTYRRYLEPGGGTGSRQHAPQSFTSWTAIYRALRSLFPADRYHTGHRVEVDDPAHRAELTVAGKRVAVDLVVGADGANSSLRRTLLPSVKPAYAGYVAWRGTLPEADAPRALVDFFDDTFAFSKARSGGHILHYFIPGDGAATRRMNWVWYVRTPPEDLPATLTDREGTTHRGSLRPGEAGDEARAALQRLAHRELHPRLAALVEATPEPFVQVIGDVIVPRTVFHRTILAGDAAFVVRPHTAGATAKAAHDALALAVSLRAHPTLDEGLRAAQDQQLRYGRAMTEHGIALGARWASAR